MNRLSKTEEVARAKDLLTGISKHFSNASQELQFGGTTRKVSDITTAIQAVVTQRQDTLNARAGRSGQARPRGRAQTPARTVVITDSGIVREGDARQLARCTDRLRPPASQGPDADDDGTEGGGGREAQSHTRCARGTRGTQQKKGIKGAAGTRLVVTAAVGSSSSAQAPPVTAAPGCGDGDGSFGSSCGDGDERERRRVEVDEEEGRLA